ncbi:hypothetical protein [Empedobacter falsenii]|uniref:hypothetical protein n=2 Tax=Empedobacter falsenii TaxID=343874 RepID=UPI00257920C9|nr:hypothetical protein [Empedobacter falsenii]
MMKKGNKYLKTSDNQKDNIDVNQKRQAKKEEKVVNLIIEIILSTTLKEYYEKSNKIP